MLDYITPVILTFNEKENIERTLSKLAWAQDVVIVDSFSTDDTVERARHFEQVRVFQRAFDYHSAQWNFAIKETGISTDWVLALDADYVLSDRLIQELKALRLDPATAGYQVNFRYCVFGKPLQGSLYPPVTVLYRRDLAEYVQDGHTQRVVVNGVVKSLAAEIYHDDRKPLSHWLQAQDRYMRLEAETISKSRWRELHYADRLRKLILFAPFIVFLNCLLTKRGMFDGKAGLYYALQRMFAETLLSMRLIENQFRKQE